MEKFDRVSDTKMENIPTLVEIEKRTVREHHGRKTQHSHYVNAGLLTEKGSGAFYNDGVSNADYLNNGDAVIEKIEIKNIESECPRYFILGWSNQAGGAHGHSVEFSSRKTIEYDVNDFVVEISSGVTDNSGQLQARSYSEMRAIMEHTGWTTVRIGDKYIEGWTDTPVKEETKDTHIYLQD